MADGSALMRVGLMLYTESGGSNSNTKGGYVRAAIRDILAEVVKMPQRRA